LAGRGSHCEIEDIIGVRSRIATFQAVKEARLFVENSGPAHTVTNTYETTRNVLSSKKNSII
jgi:hypothetical protein